MATVPSTLVFVTGQVVTAAQLNGNPGGTWGPFVLGAPECQVRQTVSQNMTTSVWTSVTFDTEDQDTDNWHSVVANTQQVKPQTPGWVRVSGGVSFGTNATGRRATRWLLNGSVVPGSRVILPATATGGASVPARTMVIQVNGSTDEIELQGFQESGGTLATDVSVIEAQSSFTAEWRGTQ